MSQPVDFTTNIDPASVKGKNALVTGAASGIGAATAKALALGGAYVTIADINDDAGERYASELQQQGLNVKFQHFESQSWTTQVAAFKACRDFGPNRRVDIVISCAGIVGNGLFHDAPFLPTTDTSGDPQPPSILPFTVNLIGSYYTAVLAIYYSREYTEDHAETVGHQSSKPLLILIASNIAYGPIPTMTTYSASKCGVRGMWASLRTAPDVTGLRMNLVAPHIVRTPMTVGVDVLVEARGAKLVELESVVDVLMRLCCDETVDGRAVGVLPSGPFDFEDNEDGLFGSKAFLGGKGEIEQVWALMEELLTPTVRGKGSEA